jgi:hypothetical protein
VTDDWLTDLAESYGMRAAGRYLGKFGRYPAPDDADDFADGLWPAAWEELRGRGADDGLPEDELAEICHSSGGKETRRDASISFL